MASDGDEHHQHHHSWWDVFLSFAGEDTRNGFVDHLYSALEKSRILTFKDDEKLKRGEPISHTLLEAIEKSMIAVVVFSKKYASSRWCLDELVKIMDCHRRCSSSGSSCNSSSMGLGPKTVVVIPIFYHVDPSDVRNPIKNGYFGGNIITGQHDPAQVEIWRKALEVAGNLAGHVVNDTINRHEAKFIDTLVKEIWSKLPDTRSSEDEHLVGMEPHIEKVISLLDAESDVVCFIGIWGLSGIGKTTLAKAIFRRMRNRFQVACFLEQVEERHGPRHLEKELVNYLKINNACEGDKIMSRLRFVSVLLILDDVDGVDIDQLEEFFRKLRLGPGSKILITTRDKHLLDMHGVDEKNTYEAKLLNDDESIRLFRRMAFKRIYPTKEFEHLSYEVIKYADGLPLALKVFGGALCGRNLAFWKASLEKLRKGGPGGDIREKLKIGFDDLDEEVQATFLDIACILEGMEKEHATRILDSFGFFPDHSIQLLVDKSLIYSGGNTLRMHNLIREMGRRIDRKKPRRLWDTNDFERILKCGTGAKNIECILLHPPDLEGKCMDITTEALRKMPKLRLLIVRNVRSHQAPKYLSSELRWLIWNEFPLESLPPKAYNLVGLELHRSNIKRLWKGKEMMDKLMHIDLSFSPLIESTPDFTSTPNLEVLILRDCENLKVVHQSLGALERLVRLDLIGCKNLETFPNSIHSKSLQTFRLTSCKKLQNFPEIPVIMENLSGLNLSVTGIRELPSPIEHFPNLKYLMLIDCKNFASLPGTFCKLKRLTSLDLAGCSKLDKLPEELGNLECLEVLYLDGTGIKEVPSSIEHLSCLERLYMWDCKNLRSLPSAICKLKRLSWLYLSGCSELEKLPEELGSLECLKTLDLDRTAITQLPLSIRFLNNLNKLELSRSSQSRTSIIQSLFNRKRKRQEDDSTWSLVLPFVWDFSSLRWLRLAGCNILDGEIPTDLESGSLMRLDLGGNCFVQLPSLNQLSKLESLCLDGCKMLEALPELPSSIRVLSADDCPSLRLSVDRITNCRKLYKVSFSNCLQLLKEDNGESKSEAVSTLWQRMIEVNHRMSSIILPGGDIPKWFSKQTTGGHSISFELPSNWSNNFKGVGFCVAFAPYKYFGRREKVPADVCVQIRVRNRHSNHHYVVHHYDDKYSDLALAWREINISMENVWLNYQSFDSLWQLSRADMNDLCEMEVSIKNSSPNTSARVTKWGMGLVPNYIKQYDDNDDRP